MTKNKKFEPTKGQILNMIKMRNNGLSNRQIGKPTGVSGETIRKWFKNNSHSVEEILEIESTKPKTSKKMMLTGVVLTILLILGVWKAMELIV